jgi:hypothetical protein
MPCFRKASGGQPAAYLSPNAVALQRLRKPPNDGVGIERRPALRDEIENNPRALTMRDPACEAVRASTRRVDKPDVPLATQRRANRDARRDRTLDDLGVNKTLDVGTKLSAKLGARGGRVALVGARDDRPRLARGSSCGSPPSPREREGRRPRQSDDGTCPTIRPPSRTETR